jgi:Uma2 family endonuclease
MPATLTRPDLKKPAMLHNGDNLDQPTFHRLYEQTAEGFRAELVGGIVYVASPIHLDHSNPHALITSWLCEYQAVTPGLGLIHQTTTILGENSEPEPDGGLYILPSHGGTCHSETGKTLTGAPEFVVEIANSTVAIDLNQKKRDYETFGVQEYLVILAPTQTVKWWELVEGEYQEIPVSGDGLLHSRVFPGLWLDPVGPFQATNRPLLHALRLGVMSPEFKAFASQLAQNAAS